MGVDTSGNGVFEGKVMAESGKIGGWNLDANRIYMADTGISSYGRSEERRVGKECG